MKQRRLVLALLSLLTLSAFGDDGVPELVFLPDVNNDKPLDLSDGKDQHIMYFPLWNREDHVQEYDGEWSYGFEYVEDFRLIPNPRIDEEHGMILGRHGQDAEIWRFDGMSKIEKVSVKQGYY